MPSPDQKQDGIIHVKRSDAIYNMHGYLTKVPYGAIVPFIERFCPAGGNVVDMFAGSGMTAVAAKIANRNAIVSDISELGCHIGTGYLTEVDIDEFVETGLKIIRDSKQNVGTLYDTIRTCDQSKQELSKTIWSFVYECKHCQSHISYYRILKAANWLKSELSCTECGEEFVKKGSKKVGETPEVVSLKGLKGKLIEQPIGDLDRQNMCRAEASGILDKIPNTEISAHREMYKRSALEKWRLTETKNFFSARNAAVLFDLWNRIRAITDDSIQKKLLFAFTAILPRASKRYQWSKKAPLNAANQNYYIAPVFYEWNVYDLFCRKLEAAKKSDQLVFSGGLDPACSSQCYVTASADNLKHIDDNSIDYVYTDPPFGSNIFYSDMNLFQEVWLEGFTDHAKEAVIRTTGTTDQKELSRQNYQGLLAKAFREAYRILKPGGHLSIVFGNSKGEIWAMAQSAIRDAGFHGMPTDVHILDKGQRSVKGLNSGSESIVTLDLIVTVQKKEKSDEDLPVESSLEDIIQEALDATKIGPQTTASHIYLEVVKEAIYHGLPIAQVDLRHVLSKLAALGYTSDAGTGFLEKDQ